MLVKFHVILVISLLGPCKVPTEKCSSLFIIHFSMVLMFANAILKYCKDSTFYHANSKSNINVKKYFLNQISRHEQIILKITLNLTLTFKTPLFLELENLA